MNVHVISPGPLTTVQDAGRTGYAARGFRTCGAADCLKKFLQLFSSKCAGTGADRIQDDRVAKGICLLSGKDAGDVYKRQSRRSRKWLFL